MLLSVIIPVFNAEQYLDRCLYSVLGSDYKDIQVVCVDDGSTDGSLNILRKYAALDSRVEILSKCNEGVSAARNAGMKMAKGEYLTFVDSDDWIHREMYSTMMRCLCENNADIAICEKTNCEEHVADERLSNVNGQIISWNKVFTTPSAKMYVWNKIYRRTIVENICFNTSLSLAEDEVFNMHVFEHSPAAMIVFCPEKLYYYFQRETSAVHTASQAAYLASVLEIMLLHKNGGSLSHYFLEESIKRYLILRFRAKWIHLNHRERNDFLETRNKLIMELKTCRHIKKVKRVCYMSFLLFPFLYGLYRIINDPTLLKYKR